VVERQDALRAPLDQLEAAVGGDPVQPRAQRAPALEAGQRAPGPQHRLLQRIVGVVHRSEHAVAVSMKLCAQRLDERPQRVLVAPLGRLEQAALGPRGR
jgi:hypothetical protein